MAASDSKFAWPNLGTAHTRIYQGDALEVLASLPDASVELIFADPPYNLGKRFGETQEFWPSEAAYLDWSYRWLQLCLDKLTPHGSFYVMTATQYMPYFDLFLRERITIRSRIVWAYDSSGVQARKYYGSLYEPLLFCVNNPRHYTFNAEAIQVEAKTGARRKLIDYRKNPPRPYNPTKVPGNVWEFPRVRYRMPEYCSHPSQKPEALLERIIRASSDPGQTVLDPFAGSFTTAVVAQRLERHSLSIERETAYIQAGQQRLGLFC